MKPIFKTFSFEKSLADLDKMLDDNRTDVEEINSLPEESDETCEKSLYAYCSDPLFLLGGFGGASARLIQLIKGETTSDKLFEECCSHHLYQEFVSYLDKEKEEMNFKALDVFSNNMDILKNGLSKEENEKLFVTTNITEIIALVLKGLHTLGC